MPREQDRDDADKVQQPDEDGDPAGVRGGSRRGNIKGNVAGVAIGSDSKGKRRCSNVSPTAGGAVNSCHQMQCSWGGSGRKISLWRQVLGRHCEELRWVGTPHWGGSVREGRGSGSEAGDGARK